MPWWHYCLPWISIILLVSWGSVVRILPRYIARGNMRSNVRQWVPERRRGAHLAMSRAPQLLHPWKQKSKHLSLNYCGPHDEYVRLRYEPDRSCHNQRRIAINGSGSASTTKYQWFLSWKCFKYHLPPATSFAQAKNRYAYYGPLLLTWLLSAWVSSHTPCFMWDVITHPYGFTPGRLSKPPLNFGKRWVTTYHPSTWM